MGVPDAYKSLTEALTHGGIANRVKVNIRWLDAELFERDDEDEVTAMLEPLHGILVPGGFGERGSEGKIAGVRFARERKVPFFGICLGMQMACIEGRARAGRRRCLDHRIRPDRGAGGRHDHRMDDSEGLQKREAGGDLGGTMRLGAYPAKAERQQRRRIDLRPTEISERHRHRYEVNTHYSDVLEKGGLVFSGMSPDGSLPEIVERPDHPWFVGVQFHPS
jgi:CTP synthase